MRIKRFLKKDLTTKLFHSDSSPEGGNISRKSCSPTAIEKEEETRGRLCPSLASLGCIFCVAGLFMTRFSGSVSLTAYQVCNVVKKHNKKLACGVFLGQCCALCKIDLKEGQG